MSNAEMTGHVLVRIEILHIQSPPNDEERGEDYLLLDEASIVEVEFPDKAFLLDEVALSDPLADLTQSIQDALLKHLSSNQPEPTETGEPHDTADH